MREITDGDYDRAAEVLYRAAGFDPSEPASPLALARRLLGPGSVRVADMPGLPGDAAITRVHGAWRIYLRRDAPPRRARFAVLHELAHWALGLDIPEEQCDALAAAMLAPRKAFAFACQRERERVPRLAQVFCASETCAALRIGEVLRAPIAVVTPDKVRVRGRPYEWPSEPELRELAKAPRLRGLRRAVLRDDPMRVVIRAAG